jgi:hypothetical protein
MSKTFVFVDERVEDRRTLLAGLPPGSRWVIVDDREHGLRQVSAALDGERDVTSIRLIAHGRPGAMQLGRDEVTQATLPAFGGEAAAIGRALATDGDVQIYGCEVGRGGVGRDFVAALAAASGAPVAASSTPVGHADRGGGWRLDVGERCTPALAAPNWRGLLGLTVSRQPLAFPGHGAGEWRNLGAFAAIRADGSVVTWGDPAYGGDNSAVAAQLDGTIGVTQLFSTRSAFVALRADGSLVTWAIRRRRRQQSAVAAELDGTIDVLQVFSTVNAFAALRADGSLVTWGSASYGGDSGASGRADSTARST